MSTFKPIPNSVQIISYATIKIVLFQKFSRKFWNLAQNVGENWELNENQYENKLPKFHFTLILKIACQNMKNAIKNSANFVDTTIRIATETVR